MLAMDIWGAALGTGRGHRGYVRTTTGTDAERRMSASTWKEYTNPNPNYIGTPAWKHIRDNYRDHCRDNYMDNGMEIHQGQLYRQPYRKTLETTIGTTVWTTKETTIGTTTGITLWTSVWKDIRDNS